MDFLKGAKDFARNPLGIIALFISLIYGFASLLLDSSADKLTEAERWPLIIFIVAFPILVLITFYKLVTKHHGKLYAPGDFKDDKSFLRTLSPEEQERKLEKEVNESLNISLENREEANTKEITNSSINKGKGKEELSKPNVTSKESKVDEQRNFMNDLRYVENTVINTIASEHKVQAEHQVGINGTDALFDAFLQMQNGKATFLEIKALRRSSAALVGLDRLLYNAVVSDKFFNSDFKLILAVVYYFDKSELKSVKKAWEQKVERCPANIELRFISRESLNNA